MKKNENFHTSIGIMNCSEIDLKRMCSIYLQRFDDLQQIAFDKGKSNITNYFVESYNALEKFYFQLKRGESISLVGRNEIRLIIKESTKLAAVEDLINWGELSRMLTGSRMSIRKNRIPEKHKPFIDRLKKSISDVLSKLKNT